MTRYRAGSRANRGAEMAIKRMAVTLDEDEIARLRQIITDEDKDGAMEFIRKVLEPKVKEAERPSGMTRAFDAGGAPGQVGGPK